MESFDEFRQNLNQRPTNTRSSLIEHQPRHNEFSNYDPQFNTPSEEPSLRYIPQGSSLRSYNYSGRPFNLSDFKYENDTAFEPRFDNVSTFSQMNDSNMYEVPRHEHLLRPEYSLSIPNFHQKNDAARNKAREFFVPYEESGRTFNLSEFATNNSNILQLPHDISSQIPIPSNTIPIRPCSTSTNGTMLRDRFEASQCQYKEKVEQKLRLPTPISNKNPLFETMVKDNYFPGMIVDSVNGQIDFNKIAFDAVFHCENIPSEIEQDMVPMSLLEAFDLRIKYEKDLRDDLERRKFFCSEEFKKEQTKSTTGVVEETSENVTYWKHRDELKLASTIDIDLMSKVSEFPETPLTEAINCLLKAEKISKYDRNVHLAEEAIRTASNGQEELAALKSTCSFKLDLQKDETKTTNTFEPLAIISYIGTTKPNYE
ncbi:uncharacterized protein LOC129909241 [Episyrphus balteatus]|uniref:uncharacterized protein LOC129909241 n=1 Tax=Episyrphus balteatus TaxID=286459 RepID=UPI002485C73B|nr:uncharacterized protein LOC129909241 [Episyrphus balteatus]